AAPAQEERAGRAPAGSVTPQTPDAEAATFRLPPGYRVELVASEPLVCEPALCVFDGDGRAYVAELCTYMQDIDGTGEDEPRSRISVLFDDDGDGRMDRRTTFAEGLVLPRLVLPLDDRVIVGETYSTTLWVYRDADRDGRAESRELLREGRRDGQPRTPGQRADLGHRQLAVHGDGRRASAPARWAAPRREVARRVRAVGARGRRRRPAVLLRRGQRAPG